MGLPGCVFLFFTAILCALGSDEPLKLTPWIPKTLKDGVQVLDLPLPKSANKVNVIVKPINGSQGNQGYEPVRFNIERKALDCGSYDLQPGQSVNIESKNFPKPFPKNWQCTWDFMASSPSSKISIECKPFNLKGCKLNSLQITGGKTNKKFCGNKKKGIKASSSNNKMTVAFTSKKRTSTGFKCTVSASGSTEPPTTTTMAPPAKCISHGNMTTTTPTTTTKPPKECGSKSYKLKPGKSVTIKSKNFPEKFPPNQKCTWNFKGTSKKSTISIVCKPFNLLKCKQTSLTLTGKNLDEMFCGKKKVIKASSSNNQMKVVFESKEKTSKGFKCKVTASKKDTTTTTTSSTTTTPTTTTTTTTSSTTTTPTTTTTTTTTTKPPKPCSKTYKLKPGKSVTIKSKNFPEKFPPNQKCTWNFKGTSKKSTISIVCKPFNLLKCKETSLTVTGKNLDERFCGKEKKGIKASSSNNQMKVVFESKKKTSKGFKCKVTASKPQPQCEPCGTVNRAKRIIGGEETEVNEYPWQVAIVYTGTNIVFCSGAVYNDLFVMTAARCGVSISLIGNMADVLLGAHDLNNLGSAQRIAVSEIISDGLYNYPVSFDHDIALLKLANRATLSDNVKPACLPNPSNDYSGVNAIVTGWGQTAEVGFTSSVLMEVEVPVISNAACKAVYLDYITDNILCTHSPNGGKDKCYYDDGAPLVVEEDGKWVVIGVGSWAVGCGQQLFPGGYERVSKYLDFLSNNAAEGKNDLCSMAP